jgi:hypothetical protein
MTRRSGSVRNLAVSGKSSQSQMEMIEETTVARPMMMKIQRQPS